MHCSSFSEISSSEVHSHKELLSAIQEGSPPCLLDVILEPKTSTASFGYSHNHYILFKESSADCMPSALVGSCLRRV